MDEDRGSNKVWPEEHLTELFRILKPLCVQYIKASHLLPDLPFLQYWLFGVYQTRCLWQSICIGGVEFRSLYNVCHVCEKNDDFDLYISIFEWFSVDFASNGVDIANLSNEMLQSRSLTQEQFEQINFVLKEVTAILEFFSCLPAVNKMDFQQLIQKKGAEIHYDCIKSFIPEICERVRPQDIRVFLKSNDLVPDMNVDSYSPREEMSEILKNIERSEVAGNWRSFLNALKNEGYESLHMMLTNDGKNTDDSKQKNILKRIKPNIVKSMEISFELLSRIKNAKLINERCYQEIDKKKNDSGDIAAAEMLLENIFRFKDGWFKSFLQILKDVGQNNVAMEIDPDFQCYPEAESQVEDEGKEVKGNSLLTTEVLKNRTNEKNLLARASSEKNCIIYIFTGRNTLALDIIKMHLAADEKNKVVYLGEPTSVNLQKHLLDTDDTNYQVSDFTNYGFDSLENELLRNQVILLTKRNLTNFKLEKLLSHFSLLLIDECHLTIKKHPYNELMKNYIDHKLDNSSLFLPQVIGLTSFNDEKPKDLVEAKDQIKILCANLDCEELCTLQDDAKYFECQTKSISSNQSDNENPFKEKVKEVMRKIENHFQDPVVSAGIKKEKKSLSVTVNVRKNYRDESDYTNWLAEIKQGFLSLQDDRIRSYCKCCWRFLNMLHNALEISNFCEIKHAYDYIRFELLHYKRDSRIYETLYKYLDEIYDIQILIEEKKYLNCRLATLKSTIEEEIRNNSWSRIVVFVQTPILVKVILKWMIDSEELRPLLPVNHQSDLYEDIIEIFERRECRLCVATRENSKMIQQKYNLKLDYFDGSFKDKNIQSASSGGNFNPECFLHQAMIHWKKYAMEDSERYRNEVRKIQRDAKSKQINKGDSNPCRPLKNKEFNILCKSCKEYVCSSCEIRKFKDDRCFVCNPDFLKDRKNKSDSGSTLKCPKCYIELGSISEDKYLLPELHINSLVIVDNSLRHVNVNKWVCVPFYKIIQMATDEELEKMIAK